MNERRAKALKQQATEVEDLQRVEPIVKSKNVSGPPVYYPPGHEMFAKKEDGAAAWRAQVNMLQNKFPFTSSNVKNNETYPRRWNRMIYCLYTIYYNFDFNPSQ